MPFLRFDDAPEPEAARNEAVVRMNASSLNRGEVLDLAAKPEGSLAGWDVAGVVEVAATDGTGPPPGTRVVGLVRAGAWAEKVAVPTTSLATLPDQISEIHAAALPSAALTALRALELGGLLLGKRLLVTGAGGGVGRFAVQLGHASGAEVSGLVRDIGKSGVVIEGLGGRPVDRIDGDFDLIIEGVGGQVFGAAIEHLAPRGLLVNIATDEREDTVTFSASGFDRSMGARIVTFNLPDELAAHGGATGDLERLCRLMTQGKLDPQVQREESWRDPEMAVDALLNKGLGGKIVLHID